ncbi:MAG: DEAD/DEAH box helicase family protein [Planctomycetes bacterium]|nr:DEAD/DEAH box helicase family protein [Planctomycetota bacterium]
MEAAKAALREEPPDYLPLRDYQFAAVKAVEGALFDDKREVLLAMATGTGKTRTCIGLLYRLIKAKLFRRVLFLVDRTSLGIQATNAFKDLKIEGQQTFTQIYDLKEIGTLKPDSDTKVHVTTIQGMVRRLLDHPDGDPPSVGAYDCIVVDECHRGYNLDREMTDAELTFRSEADYISKFTRIPDHFDAVKIGLTATPALHTCQIFGDPVYEYSYRQAVIDGYLVDHEPPIRIVTKLSEDGIHWRAGEEITVLDSRSQQIDLFHTPDDVDIEVQAFNTKVQTENFNRVVCQTLAKHIDPTFEAKTLVFCVTDAHADMVVKLLKEALAEEYGEVDDDAVQKITGAADKPLEKIRRYKNERQPNIAVTVDLLSTGIDVPAISNIVFLRRDSGVLGLHDRDVVRGNGPTVTFRLQWVGREKGVWRPLKTEETRTVPLPALTASLLPVPNAYGLLFPNTRDASRPCRRESVRDILGKAIRATGVPDPERLDTHSVAVLLVHHARKSGGARAGQALRGSSELHAWGDSNLYLRRQGEALRLTIEHRAAPSPPSLSVALSERDGGLSMAVLDESPENDEPRETSPRERVLAALSGEPSTIRDLRKLCRMRTATLCDVLGELAAEGAVEKTKEGYRRAPEAFAVSRRTFSGDARETATRKQQIAW